MKKIYSFIVLGILIASTATAQIEKPIKWIFTANKIADKTYEVHMTSMLDPTWHIYAQVAGTGPVPTSFSFTKNPLVKLDGKVKELGKQEKSYDPNFKSTLKFYAEKVDFVQKIKLKSAAATELKGSVSYMICNDRKCLPPADLPFSVKLGGK